jgi:hypothetical protein
MDIPGMTEYILSHLQDVSTEESSRNPLPRITAAAPPTSTSGLQTLLPECLAQVCTFLSIADVASLRLCCRALVLRLPLDQHFWQNRLLSGQLFGLPDMDQTLLRQKLDGLGGKDWKGLVRALARYENFQGGEEGKERSEWGELHDAPIGLKNHMRIWKIIRDIEKEQHR